MCVKNLMPAEDIATSFRSSCRVLTTVARKAAIETQAKGLCIGGGVAANSRLREQYLTSAWRMGFTHLFQVAPTTDNAAMVAATGWRRFLHDGPTLLNTGANPNLRMPEKGPPLILIWELKIYRKLSFLIKFR